MNFGQLGGNLARDPETRTAGATSVTTFTLAVNAYNPTTKTREADFIRCVAFGRTGDNIGRFAKKGRRLEVRYHLKPREWLAKDGTKQREMSVVVDDFELGPGGDRTAAPQEGAPNSGPMNPWEEDDQSPNGDVDFGL